MVTRGSWLDSGGIGGWALIDGPINLDVAYLYPYEESKFLAFLKTMQVLIFYKPTSGRYNMCVRGRYGIKIGQCHGDRDLISTIPQ